MTKLRHLGLLACLLTAACGGSSEPAEDPDSGDGDSSDGDSDEASTPGDGDSGDGDGDSGDGDRSDGGSGDGDTGDGDRGDGDDGDGDNGDGDMGDGDTGDGDSPPVCSATPVQGVPDLTVEEVASGFDEPIDFEMPPDDPRMFIVERGGTVRIIRDGQPVEPAFLDIREQVQLELAPAKEERGLLSMVFAPDFATSKRFYVAYNKEGQGEFGNTTIAEFTVSSDDPDRADRESEKLVLEIPKPSLYHNGGQLRFGPDGYLYFATGDGREPTDDGVGDHDEANNSQNKEKLLGKMLRIAPKPGGGYDIPTDNPFVGKDGRDEIWAYGLRNPFRFSFDRKTGDMYIGDVGRAGDEEVDFQPASSKGGENYGWRACEGTRKHRDDGCDTPGLTSPLLVYPREDHGLSVVGGFVYRGCRMPALDGTYFFADFYGQLFSAAGTTDFDDITEVLDGSSFDREISAFGEDHDGELYLLSWGNGRVFKLVPRE